MSRPNVQHTQERLELYDRVAGQVARYYARRVWYAEYTDLRQEAWFQVLECASWFTASDFAEYEAQGRLAKYLYQTASKSLSRYTRALSAPVTGRDAATEGLHRTELTEDRQPCGARTPEAAYLGRESVFEVTRIRTALKSRAEQLYRAQGGQDPKPCEAALRVLLDGEKPSDAAKVAGIPVKLLYKTTEWVKASCVQDELVRSLLEELRERRDYLDN